MLRRRDAGAVAVAVVCAVVVMFGVSASTETVFAAAVPLCIVAVGQDLILNRAGQASFGGAALAAVGAYVVVGAQKLPGPSFPISLVLAAIAGGVVGLVIGLPGLRVRGLYLLLSTLALQSGIDFLAEKIQGGTNAVGFFVQAPSLAGWTMQSPRAIVGLSTVVLGIVCYLLSNLYRTGAGRAWQVIREAEAAAGVMGIPTVRWKLLAFVISSALSAVGGALYAYSLGSVTSTTFSLTLAISIVVMVYVGGRRTLLGPILGALGVTFVPTVLTTVEGSSALGPGFSNWLLLNGANLAEAIYAALLLVVFVFYPGGVMEALQALQTWSARHWNRLLGGSGASGVDGADPPALAR